MRNKGKIVVAQTPLSIRTRREFEPESLAGMLSQVDQSPVTERAAAFAAYSTSNLVSRRKGAKDHKGDSVDITSDTPPFVREVLKAQIDGNINYVSVVACSDRSDVRNRFLQGCDDAPHFTAAR